MPDGHDNPTGIDVFEFGERAGTRASIMPEVQSDPDVLGAEPRSCKVEPVPTFNMMKRKVAMAIFQTFHAVN